MQTVYKKITEAPDLRGKRVLIRLDLNVPIVGNDVRDDFRIQYSLPTLEFLKKAGARVIIISHLESEVTQSLSRIAAYIQKFIPLKAFVTNYAEAPSIIDTLGEGEIIMLENLRHNSGEKENDPVFAARLAQLADIYVNDAFAVSHRKHASIVSLPKLLPSYAGLLLTKEIEELSKAFNPEHPFLFVLGGAKFSTKLPLIEKFITIADHVFVGGALANDIYKEKGYEVGMSLVAREPIQLSHIVKNPRLIVPSDVVCVDSVNQAIKPCDQVSPQDKILDAGPQTISELSDLLSDIKFVVWNGPLGDYEKGFDQGTKTLAHALIESGARVVIGGGDTIAVVRQAGLLDKISFASTGGGAMIEFLSQGTLPGIEALKS